jgi:hypothetical protein
MNKIEAEDELRPEYDIQSLQVRKLGPKRKNFCDTVRLEPDVMAAFTNAETVNEALRYLIEIAMHSASLTNKVRLCERSEPQSNRLLDKPGLDEASSWFLMEIAF